MGHYDYSGWMDRKLDMTTEWVLKSLGHIFDEADKEGLSQDELCQVKDCWTILAMLDGFHHSDESPSSNGSAPEMAARVNGTALK